MTKFIIITLAIFLVAIISVLLYLDVFSTINITEKEVGPYKLVYEEHKGAYHNIKDVQDKVYYSLLKDKIETTKGFGIYYDNPSNVPTDELRSIGGCIVEPKDYKAIELLKDKYLIKDYHSPNSVCSEFSFKNPLSIIIGILKVYPKINEYQNKHDYKPQPVLEIYDIPKKMILYSVPVIK